MSRCSLFLQCLVRRVDAARACRLNLASVAASRAAFASFHSVAWFPNLHSHRMRTRGALALCFPSSRKLARDGCRCPLSVRLRSD
eukprot:6193540-Pleurochrysis_carterae.AAC.5